ncbi:MAG: hypothetical protein WCE23_07200 [Candidatus Binatus sp.]|uniref:hypothetical protein n=1 Tax=Candidatus Binatus sp. TaxID=2811406 RepID=UPI003C775471
MGSRADKVAIGLIQMSCAPEPRLNLDKAIAKIEEAARRGAQIVGERAKPLALLSL